MSYYDWKPYVTVAERRRKAEKKLQKMNKGGAALQPIHIEGTRIAKTFWGKAWCENMERYSDYENRLPRGRAYVRNGSVLDLRIEPGKVAAMVCGSELYQVTVTLRTVEAERWKAICSDCAGAIDSLVELLQGKLSTSVMERICQPQTGLFPAPAELEFSCSCPDWADMCKHVAAVFYGIGARLDEQPELLFRLRQVNEKELIAKAAALPLPTPGKTSKKVLASDDLSALFGLEMAGPSAAEPVPPSGGKKKDQQPALGPISERKTTKAPMPKKMAAKGTELAKQPALAPEKNAAKAVGKKSVVASGASKKKAKPATGRWIEVAISEPKGVSGGAKTVLLPGAVMVGRTQKKAPSAKASKVSGKRKK